MYVPTGFADLGVPEEVDEGLSRAGFTAPFAIQTKAGEIRPVILGPTTCRVAMGQARLRSEHFPDGPEDGTGEVAGRRFQHVAIGNPQCAIRVAGRRP